MLNKQYLVKARQYFGGIRFGWQRAADVPRHLMNALHIGVDVKLRIFKARNHQCCLGQIYLLVGLRKKMLKLMLGLGI